MLLAEKYGMGLQNPVTSTQEKENRFLCVSDELIGAIKV